LAPANPRIHFLGTPLNRISAMLTAQNLSL
jgi:hypothetical protein